MGYRERPPTGPLAGLVECGWVVAAEHDEVHAVLPDGCMDLVWAGGELLVAGPDTVVHQAVHAGGSAAAGLRFAPGVLPSLLGVPAAELHNRRVPLVELAPGGRPWRPARTAIDRLEAGEAPLAALTALVARLPGAPPERSVAALRRALDVGPDVDPAVAAVDPDRAPLSVAAIADVLGCTPRSVHRRCLAAFGYGPAVLRRVLRFRRAAALLRAGVGPAETAARAGYADQPHLSREVRALAGVAPRQLASGANRSTPLPSGSCTTA